MDVLPVSQRDNKYYHSFLKPAASGFIRSFANELPLSFIMPVMKTPLNKNYPQDLFAFPSYQPGYCFALGFIHTTHTGKQADLMGLRCAVSSWNSEFEKGCHVPPEDSLCLLEL